MKIWSQYSHSIVLCILCILLSILMFLPSIRSRTQTFLQPLFVLQQTLADTVLDSPDSLSLEQEVIALRAEVSSLLYLKQENTLLRDALELQNETQLSPVKGDIVAYDNVFLRNSALLNVGSNDGIQLNQAVIYLGHLVGQIVEVSNTSSRVRFLSDPESSIGVTIENEANSQGILKSLYASQLIIDLVPRLEEVSEGQSIYTSGIGYLPPGLFVGTIDSVEEGDLFYNIVLSQPINSRRLTTVFVLTEFQE